MSTPCLAKPLLALAVATASLNGHAITHDISSGPLQREDARIDEPLTITGTLVITDSTELRGIDIARSRIDYLENASTLTATGQSTNSATGIRFDNSMSNGLSNTGALIISSESGKAVGLQIVNSFMDDDTLNAGDIKANGAQAIGLKVTGFHSIASITNSTIAGDLLNSGKIEANGSEEAIGIRLSDMAIEDNLVNEGSVIARGSNSTGILLDDVRIDGELLNSGIVQGDHYGIRLGSGDDMRLHIHQMAGLIEGGQYAIDAGSGNRVSVELAGGTVSGNIAGVFKVGVTGKAVFDGERIDTFFLDGAGNGWVEIDSGDDSPDGTNGHLVLARPHTILDGELDIYTGSILELNLSQATDSNRAILDISKTATFAPGSRMLLTPVGSDFSANGRQYILLSAGKIENYGLQISSSSALLNIDTTSIDDTQIRATVTAKGADEAGEIAESGGASRNAQAAFGSFYSNVLNRLDSTDPVLQAFAAADESTVAILAEQLAPQVDHATTQAAISTQNLISGAVGSRTSALRGASSGSPFSQTGVWLQVLNSSAEQARRDGIAGYDADSNGIAIGVDGKLLENLTLGVAYGALETDVKSDNGNKTDVTSQALTLYSGYENGNLFVDASLTYGSNDNSAKRYIAGSTAKGDYDSRLLGLNLTTGYSLHFDNITLEPRLAGRYSRIDIDAFSEKGSPAALRQKSQRYEVIELGAGMRLAGLFQAGQGILEPELRLMAYHDFAADQARSTSSYVLGGLPFVTNGARPKRDSYEAGIGLTYRLGAVSMGASYDRIGRSDFDADVFQAKVRYDF